MPNLYDDDERDELLDEIHDLRSELDELHRRCGRLAAVARAATEDVAARVVEGVVIESCAVQVSRTAAALELLHEGDLEGLR